MSFKCPKCDRPLYNRRRKWCEFCGSPVPEAQLLSQSQMAALDKLKAAEAKQHKEFMEQPDGLPGGSTFSGFGGEMMI